MIVETVHHVQAILDRIKYKDYSFKTVVAPQGTIRVVLVARVVERDYWITGQRGDVIKIMQSTDYLPGRFNESEFIDFIFNQCKMLEIHELEECFYVNGERIKDPHARV